MAEGPNYEQKLELLKLARQYLAEYGTEEDQERGTINGEDLPAFTDWLEERDAQAVAAWLRPLTLYEMVDHPLVHVTADLLWEKTRHGT